MLFDLAALGQAAIAYATDAMPLYATAGVTYFFGPMAIHLWHARVGNITAAAISRLLAPGLGAGVGALVAGPHTPDAKPIAIGVGIGCLTAAIVDDALISHEMLQFWERTGSISIAPQVTTRDGARVTGFTISGSF
jgi:hypothetical protein